eukprot:scaffold421174_cov79-Attheya_sp.AAC.1
MYSGEVDGLGPMIENHIETIGIPQSIVFSVVGESGTGIAIDDFSRRYDMLGFFIVFPSQ